MGGPWGRPRIALVTTGGTIEAIGGDRLDLVDYSDRKEWLPPGGLLARVPEVSLLAEICEVSLDRLDSTAMGPSDWLRIGREIQTLLDGGGIDGVVLSHGSDTLEETAYFLHLTLETDVPVVAMGSLRPASSLSADGDMNLYRAVQVAAHPSARGRGVLVVVNDTIFSARDVTKGSSYRLDAFRGVDSGPLGYADSDGQVVFVHQPSRLHTRATRFCLTTLGVLPRVDVVLSYAGADGALIDAAVAVGAKGIVSAGMGAGTPSPQERQALLRAVERGVVVCQSTRVGAGRVGLRPNLREVGIVGGDNLPPWKARVLLMLALPTTRDPARLQELFNTH